MALNSYFQSNSTWVRWNQVAPYLAIIAAAFLFSGMQVFTKPSLEYISPLAFAFLRLSLAIPPLGLFAYLFEETPKYTSKAFLWHLIMGLFGVVGSQSLVFVGNQLAGPDIVAIMQPSIPIYVALYSMMFRLERFSWWKLLGIAFSIFGCLNLVHIDHLNLRNHIYFGTAIMVVQTLCYSAFLILMNIHLKVYPYPLTAFFRVSIWGWMCMLILCLVFRPSVVWDASRWWVWASLIYAGIMTSFVAHSLMVWAVGKVSAVMPALSTCLQPAITITLVSLLFGSFLSVRDILGMAMIIFGLLIIVWVKFQESNLPRETCQQELEQLLIDQDNDSDSSLELDVLLPIS